MRRWAVSSVVVGVLVIGQAASACQCGSYPKGWEAVAFADVVARGTLISIQRTVMPVRREYVTDYSPFPFVPVNQLTFAVSAVWKGEPASRLVLYEMGCCVCEYGPFNVGGEYLLYATPHNFLGGVLMASFCFPTKPASRAEADLRELGQPAATPPRTRDAVSVRQETIQAAKATLAKSLDWVFKHHRENAGPRELFAEWIVLLASPIVVLVVGLGVPWWARRLGR
jgi:hypothetical protein